MSHTTKVKVEFRSMEALQKAVENMGGKWLGEGTHSLYGRNTAEGHGFTIPGMAYPMVLEANGSIATDYYRSKKNSGHLDDLTGTYTLQMARQEAQQRGMLVEDCAEGIRIYHPDGGTLVVDSTGKIDATGFTGTSCTQASQDIVSALGSQHETLLKDDYYIEQATIKELE